MKNLNVLINLGLLCSGFLSGTANEAEIILEPVVETETHESRETEVVHPCHYYSTTLLVVEVDEDANVLYAETSTGFRYNYSNPEDLLEGDLVTALMDDRGTPTIEDDVPLHMSYSGFYLY